MCLVAAMGNANASELAMYNVTIDVSSETISYVQIRAVYNSLTTEKLSFIFFNEFSNFKAADSKGLLQCIFSKSSSGTEVICTPNENRKNVSSQTPYAIAMSFDVHDIVAKRKNPFIFFVHLVANPTNLLRVKVLLPEGAVLPDTNGVAPFYPQNAEIGGTGRRVILQWNMQKPPLGDRINFTAEYELSYARLLGVTVTVVALLIMAIVGIFYYKNKQGKLTTVISVLKGDEKKVIDVIRAHGNSCKQRDIVRETDFSKAKISRIITLLEERGIVQKDRKGRTNKVFLADADSKPKQKREETKATEEKAEPKQQEDQEPKRPFGQ